MLRIAPGMGSHGGSRDPSRRSFLNTSAGALGGLALASALGLAPRRARAATTMSYAFWPWGSEIVEADAKLFEEEYGEAINLQPIPGDYAAVLETKLSANQPFDLYRAQRGQASRWYAAGWIRPIDGLPDLDKIFQRGISEHWSGRAGVA